MSMMNNKEAAEIIREAMASQCDCGTHTARRALNEAMKLAITSLDREDQSRWISVDERLPEPGVHVLACCHAGINAYVCDAFYTAPKTVLCRYDDDIDAEYDEETDEYYFPRGWWEVIKNWDDYGCIAICDKVTHWRALPEPPKERVS